MTGEFAIAVHALVYLSHKNTTLPSEVLAENVCTNPARIRKVMAKLKKAKLVVTKEGQNGGYQLKKSASDINLKEVCCVLEEKVVKASWRSGNPDMDCLVASGMAKVMDGIYEQLNFTCLTQLQQITIQDIENEIFKD